MFRLVVVHKLLGSLLSSSPAVRKPRAGMLFVEILIRTFAGVEEVYISIEILIRTFVWVEYAYMSIDILIRTFVGLE